MPESPEVQVLVEFLRDRLTGHTIVGTDLAEFRAQKTRDRPLDELVGASILGAARFGKHVDLVTDVGHLVISLGRAGWALWTDDGEQLDVGAPVIATLSFDDGGTLSLVDNADWPSLGVSVVDDPQQVSAIAKLGPDPLSADFARADFDAAIGSRRKQLKALITEQETLAGIGNAYSDEILHVAKLSPVAHASALTGDERDRLFAAITGVLRDTLTARRGARTDQLKAIKVAAMRVHGRTGQPCPVCGDRVLDIPGSKGGAQYCPTCQSGGIPL